VLDPHRLAHTQNDDSPSTPRSADPITCPTLRDAAVGAENRVSLRLISVFAALRFTVRSPPVGFQKSA
jgi:hypothetical protein